MVKEGLAAGGAKGQGARQEGSPVSPPDLGGAECAAADPLSSGLEVKFTGTRKHGGGGLWGKWATRQRTVLETGHGRGLFLIRC